MRRFFGRKETEAEDTGIQEVTPEEIRERAELNDTGAFPKFGADMDFPDPDILCVHITGQEAIDLWVEAIEKFVAGRRSATLDAFAGIAENIEILDGAAHEGDQQVRDVTFDPWRYEKRPRN